MPQIENKDILGCILRSTIDVIGRRTSEAYANVFISNTIKELSEKYSFLRFIEIKDKQYTETIEIISIDSDVNNVETKEIGKAANDFMIKIIQSMGKNAGYYFIREIKESLPIDYETLFKQLGIDLDFLQLQFVTDIKEKFKFKIENYDILLYSIKGLFNILEKEFDKNTSLTIISDLIIELRTQYEVLDKIKIHDTRSVQGIDPITVDKDVNLIDAQIVGDAIQNLLQELNKYCNQKSNISLVNEIRSHLNSDYLFKLEEMGVNLNVLQLSEVLVFKHVLKALVDLINDVTSQSYAILLVNTVIEKFKDRYPFLEHVKIDGTRFSEGYDAILVPENIDSVRGSEIGRGIQKIMEKIIRSLGDKAGAEFTNNFKKRLGKAFLLRIEEMGANLHLIQLKQDFMK